jgi:multiple antibiotic resistance protein
LAVDGDRDCRCSRCRIVWVFRFDKLACHAAAIATTGAIILFYQALRIVMQTRRGPPSSPAIAVFPLAIPALVTAPGIAAITAIVIINKRDLAHETIIFGMLLAIMANLFILLNTDAILKRVSPGLLYLVGWVLAVLRPRWPCRS